MMQQMRGFAKSWVSSVFLLILALSFGVWGIGDMIRGRSVDTSVATVGDVKITPEQFQREFRNVQRRLSSRQGHVITVEEARAQGVDRQVLDDEIGSAALDQAVSHYDLLASDAQVSSVIRAQPAFRNPLGTFDHGTFLQVLAQNNLTEDEYIGLIRGELTRNQLLTAAANGMQMPPGYAKLFFEFINERRVAEYVQVTSKDLPATPAPTDAQLAAFLKTHSAQFSTPEYRDVTYLSVGPDDVAKQLTVSDSELKQRYDLEKDKYQIPEKRDVEQIIFPDQASAKAARAKIDAGAKFDDIAKSMGKSPTDTSLGALVQADLGADRGPPTFALAVGGITQPVKFTFGWVLLHVTGITPGINKTFDSVKDTLRSEEIKELAGAKITDISNAFEDARAGGASFTDAAIRVGMRVTHIPLVDKNGNTPDGTKANLPDAPEFQAQLAKADVGEEGDPFATADVHYYAIKVNGVTPAKLKPLDGVRAQITAAWTADQRSQQLARLAASLAKKATAEHGLTAVAAQLHETVQSSGGLTRQTQSSALPQNLVSLIFAAQPGTAVSAPASDGAYIVARVTGVSHPQVPAANPINRQIALEIGNQAGQDADALLSNAWRDKLGVTINQSQFEHLAGGS
jgi:peptidyl-prolyl cis-trans isomerase D